MVSAGSYQETQAFMRWMVTGWMGIMGQMEWMGSMWDGGGTNRGDHALE